MRSRVQTRLLAATLALTAGAAAPAASFPRSDFEANPAEAGWSLGHHPHQTPKGSWIDTTSASGRHALRVEKGWWASPRFEVEPFACYRLRFAAAAEGKAYWSVQFFDAAGRVLAADHYASIYPSEEWRSYEFCFRSRLKAATAEVRFQAMAAPLLVDDAAVEPISRPDVARWADRIYAAIPPIDAQAVPPPSKLLARTLARLRKGGTLRIVLLGDSIMNDTGNSAFDVLIERLYPRARIELIHSVRGGTGCPYYRRENRVQSYVLDLEPDLLIIGGISNGHDPEAIRDVVRQVRARSDPDILVLSGAVAPWELFLDYVRKLPAEKRQPAIERAKHYRPRLARMAAEEKVATLDIRALWDAYVERIRKPPMWLRRDPPHANARGHQVLARILAAYFAPREGGDAAP